MLNEKKKIILIVYNKLFWEAIKIYLQNILSYEIINESSDGNDFLSQKNINQSDVLIIDIRIPQMDGIEIVKQILYNSCNTKIIALLNNYDNIYLQEIIKVGFKACVYKSKINEELDNAIKKVLEGKVYFPKEMKH
ncbi:MAG: response regulator transcription factor [Chlorobi bacterium]|nr:response regulator transcription factor [Chlorobiota bacterium]